MIYYYHHNFLVCNLAEWIIKKKRHGIINGFVRLDGGKDSKHGGQNTAAHLYGFIILYCSFASLPVFLSIIIIILLFPCHVCLFLSDSVCCIPPPPTESLWIWWIGRWMALVRLIRPAIESARIGLKKKNNPARILLLFLLLFQEIRPY